MSPEDQEKNLKNNGNDAKAPKWKNLFCSYLMSLLLMFIGFAWRNDIKTKGYYVDGKHQIAVSGDEGLVTVYALIVGGFLMLAYSIYLTIGKSGKTKITG